MFCSTMTHPLSSVGGGMTGMWMQKRFRTATWQMIRLMCSWRQTLGGGTVIKSTFFLGSNFISFPPHLPRSILQQSLSTLVIWDYWLYIRQTKSSHWRCNSSETSPHSPSFSKSMKLRCFPEKFYWLHLANPFKCNGCVAPGEAMKCKKGCTVHLSVVMGQWSNIQEPSLITRTCVKLQGDV